MIGIIWYCDKNNGQNKLEKIIEDYKRKGIAISYESKNLNQSYAQFENGDIWKTAPGKEGQRGSCCNISLIERSIPIDIYECIIKPCTKALPYQAIGFYGD